MKHSTHKPTVLCVDDEQNVLSALQRELTLFGCVVRTTSDPTAVERMLMEHDVDVLITDASMPRMNGVQVLERAINASPGTARIMLTGHCDRVDIVVPAVNRGEIYRLVPKPWDRDDLRSAIAESMCMTVAEWEARYTNAPPASSRAA